MQLVVARATLGTIWDKLADVYGDNVALTLEEPLTWFAADRPRTNAHVVTYTDFADLVARASRVLADAGVEPGERVAVCAANRIEYAIACFAAVRAGAIAIPLHHHLRPSEIDAMATRANATYLVCDAHTKVTRPGLTTLTIDAGGAFERAEPMHAVPSDADEPAMILFTSGTTGAPKGATMTSRSLLAVARLAALAPDARKESGVCGLPLAHVMGMSTLLCACMAGAPMHWISKFDARVVLDRLEERRASFFVGVPAMYAMLAEHEPEQRDLSSVRLFASGADAMPPALVDRFRKLGCAFASPRGRPLVTAAFAEIYGMVELSGPAILKITPPEPFADGPITAPAKRALAQVSARLTRTRALAAKISGALKPKGGAPEGKTAGDALGIPIPPYRARVVDDNGKPVKAGVVGELVLKGPGVTKGYDGDAEATAKTTHDGWLKTGDLAWQNRLGLIAFATRKKDVVKHGGFSVFPAEVEAQMGAHASIAECVVFGLPHSTKGAVPAAAVVLAKGAHMTERELLAWARENIAPFKAPRAIAIVASGDIPRNANKKVLKDELRAQLLTKGALVTS